jgi:hypothetical protein
MYSELIQAHLRQGKLKEAKKILPMIVESWNFAPELCRSIIELLLAFGEIEVFSPPVFPSLKSIKFRC